MLAINQQKQLEHFLHALAEMNSAHTPLAHAGASKGIHVPGVEIPTEDSFDELSPLK